MADEKPDETPYKADTEKPTRHKRDRKEVSDVVDRLVARYGTERAALAVLADENLDFRESVRDLKTKVIGEGERKLTAAEVKEWDAFTALGKSAKELATAIGERDTFATENAGLKAEKLDTDAATTHGLKPAVLSRILRAEGYRITEVKDGTDKDGNPTRTAYAQNGEADPVPLTELIEGPLADYKPALAPEAPQKPNTAGPQYPTQSPRGTAPAPKEKSLDDLKAEKRATGAYSA